MAISLSAWPRVGAEGKVYAVDIDEEAVDKVRRRKESESSSR